MLTQKFIWVSLAALKALVFVFREIHTNPERIFAVAEILFGAVLYGTIFGIENLTFNNSPLYIFPISAWQEILLTTCVPQISNYRSTGQFHSCFGYESCS
jgi:hypothetical protein